MNREAYVQDNWKATDRLTLDYGVRFVNATPLHDELMQGGNWLPERWTIRTRRSSIGSAAQRRVSLHGKQSAGDESRDRPVPRTDTAVFVGTLVPNSGDPRNALFAAGQGIAKTNYTFPKLVVGPRVGMAYDVTGKQRMVVRGGIGMYFDRPRPGDAQALAAITGESVTVRYSQLQNLGAGGLTTQGASSITASSPTPSCRRRRRGMPGCRCCSRGQFARRRLHRPLQLQRRDRRPGFPHQHQHDRPRNGVQSGAAGSDPRAERHRRGLLTCGTESESSARISGLQHHPVPAIRRLAEYTTRSNSLSIAGS